MFPLMLKSYKSRIIMEFKQMLLRILIWNHIYDTYVD